MSGRTARDHMSFRWHLTVLWPDAAISLVVSLMGLLTLGYVAPNWSLRYLLWVNCRIQMRRKAHEVPANV